MSVTRDLRLLDVHFRLAAPRDEWFSLLDTMYAAPEFSGRASAPFVAHSFEPERAGEPPAGRPVGPEPALRVVEWVFRELLARSRDYLLVHAGALTEGEDGVLVVGPPFAGKTTLTSALAEEGLGYFSDDVGAIRRADGLLHPFRRRAGVRLPEGGRRYVLPGSGDGTAGPVPPPRRVAWLFVLEAPRMPSVGVAGPWTLILDARLSAHADRLERRDDVGVVGVSQWGGGLRLDFAPTTGAALGAAVAEVLGADREGILYLGPTPRVWEKTNPPEPRVSPLASAEAAGEVMRHLLNRAADEALDARFGRHPHLKLLAEVLAWLPGIRAYRVAAGTPAATARRLRALIASTR